MEPRLATLLERLMQHRALARAGYISEATLDGILVHRKGHARGIWRSDGNRLSWTPAGYNEATHFVVGVDEAVALTVAALLP